MGAVTQRRAYAVKANGEEGTAQGSPRGSASAICGSPGLRPDKILKLHEALGLTSLAELEAAAKEDRIRPVKGLGASLQTKILQNLSIARSGET